jgi:DNA polymerase V
MIGAGIYDSTILVIDRAAEAEHRDIVVARFSGRLTVKRLLIQSGGIWLKSENPEYKPLRITKSMNFEVFGRVIYSINAH